MGYFKNQELEQVIEVGDRIPAPKPAHKHIAYPTRRSIRAARNRATQWRVQTRRELIVDIIAYGGIGLVVGTILGVVIL